MAAAYSGIDQHPDNSGATACAAFAKPSFSNATLETVLSPTSGASFHWVKSPLDANSWYIIDGRKRLRRWTPGQTVAQASLLADLSARVGELHNGWTSKQGGSEEWGVVSFALHPQFATDPAKRLFYVVYTGKQTSEAYSYSHLSEFPMTASGTIDTSRERVLLRFPQATSPYHHFDHVVFGPDGYLYISMGEGGERTKSQDKMQISRGKVLRLDVDARQDGKGYGYPPDNPYATDPSFAPEVFAYGLRNPWRFSFDKDPLSGETTLWLGDVGASNIEELDHIEKGKNYGWPIYEADECRDGPCSTPGLTSPVYRYSHAEGSSIIGGFVYRGTESGLRWLRGKYVFGDWSSSTIFYLEDENGSYLRKPLAAIPDGYTLNGFATDLDGNLYVAGMSGVNSGGFWRLKADPAAPPRETAPHLLSDTHCVNMADPTRPAPGTIPYNVAQALWSDNAQKYRFLALPPDQKVTVSSGSLDFQFPNGTVLVKTFLYADVGHPHETRLLMRYADGTWGGYSYVWNGADAELVPPDGLLDRRLPTNNAGGVIRWTYPSQQACWRCHTQAAGVVLGPETVQLNNWLWYPTSRRTANQLDTWQAIGMLGALPLQRQHLPALAMRRNQFEPAIRQARGYLHANCSFCHRPNGTPQASIDFRYHVINSYGHFLQVPPGSFCNISPTVPDGDLGVTGARLLTPGSPDQSIFYLRMKARQYDPNLESVIDPRQMPPLGTVWRDVSASTTIFEPYIRNLDVCQIVSTTARESATPDLDGVPQQIDNCTLDYNPAQYDFDGDGYGQACDADLDNNGVITAADQALLTQAMGSTRGQWQFNEAADFNADDTIDAQDQAIFDRLRARSTLPGPSGVRPAL